MDRASYVNGLRSISRAILNDMHPSAFKAFVIYFISSIFISPVFVPLKVIFPALAISVIAVSMIVVHAFVVQV